MMAGPLRPPCPYPSFPNEYPNNTRWNYQGHEVNKQEFNNYKHLGGNNNFAPQSPNFSIPPPSLSGHNNSNSNRPHLPVPAPYHTLATPNNCQPPAPVNIMNRPPPVNIYRPPPLLNNVNSHPQPFSNSPNQFNFPGLQRFPPADNARVSFHPPQPSFTTSQSHSVMLPPPNNLNANDLIHPYSDKQQPVMSAGGGSHFNVSHHNKIQEPSQERFVSQVEKKRKTGEQRLASWLQKIGKAKKKVAKEEIKVKPATANIKINEYLCKLQTYVGLIGGMLGQVDRLEAMTSEADKSTWQKECDIMETLKAKHRNMQNVVEKANVEQAQRKLIGTRQKRSRLKRSRHQRYQETQEVEEARQVKEKDISDWQQKLLSEMKDKLLKKKRKMDMDQTLSEVTKKINDANRLIDTMTSLEKLRLIRQDAAEKRGDTDLGESRQSFEQKIADMTRLVRSQLEVYKEEEKKLRKVIKSEQEELSKKERQLQKKKDQEEQMQKDEDLRKKLFGDSVDAGVSVSLFPYQQFYRQAETSLPALIQIRHEWDQYIVPAENSNGSPIPPGWLHPCDPTSAAWASALI